MRASPNRWELMETVNLGLLGIAKKAGFIEAGEEMVTTAVSAGRARLIITASDIGDSSQRKAETLARRGNVPILTVPTEKSELGLAVGRGVTGILAVTDIGIAASFASGLKDLGGSYETVAAVLGEKDKKARQRRKEAEIHRKNKRTGKRRTK